jgi:hypothetical protein
MRAVSLSQLVLGQGIDIVRNTIAANLFQQVRCPQAFQECGTTQATNRRVYGGFRVLCITPSIREANAVPDLLYATRQVDRRMKLRR